MTGSRLMDASKIRFLMQGLPTKLNCEELTRRWNWRIVAKTAKEAFSVYKTVKVPQQNTIKLC